ncbi:MAG: enoyl-CoA hydratase/isomerase family protein, partial [Methylocystaceae bacterium]
MSGKWPDYSTLLLEYVEPGILVVALNRPQSLNAVSRQMLEDLKDLWQRLKYDMDTRVVILRGSGDKGFCGGVDVREQGTDDILKVPGMFEYQRQLSDLQLQMRTIPQPIICLVQGAAAGAGFSFSLASDIRIITPEAR